MDTIAAGGESGIRVATEEDIPWLARHHRLMFEEILVGNGIVADPGVMALLEKEYAAKLAREFKSGTCTSWVAVKGDRIVASGAVSILQYVPVPHDLSCQVAYLHSVYTAQEYRNQHHATRIARVAADFCSKRGIKRLYLFASTAGTPVYEKAGFVPVPNMMQLLR